MKNTINYWVLIEKHNRPGKDVVLGVEHIAERFIARRGMNPVRKIFEKRGYIVPRVYEIVRLSYFLETFGLSVFDYLTPSKGEMLLSTGTGAGQ